MFFNSIKWANKLRKKIKRPLSKQMKIVNLKVTIEKKWPNQIFDFLSLKSSSPGQFLGSSKSRKYHRIFKSDFKNQRSGSETVRGFSIIFILKGIMAF